MTGSCETLQFQIPLSGVSSDLKVQVLNAVVCKDYNLTPSLAEGSNFLKMKSISI